jgi:glycosyltransferase involved in cell wall biosynthesis
MKLITSKVAIISCTQKKESEKDSLMIYRSFTDCNFSNNVVLDIIWENKQGLGKAYNRCLEYYKNKNYDFLVFVHDDVYLDDTKLVEKLQKSVQDWKFDIIGLAGGLNPRIQHPALWHIMCPKQDQRGQVQHPASEKQIYYTAFGPTPARVTMVDGVFIAVNMKRICEVGWKFNENYKFHHYDLSSCIDANRLKLKIGVYPIHIIHLSPGLRSLEDAEWKESNQKFLKEYGS